MNEILLKYWVLCSVVLAAKMWMNSAIQVLARFKNKQFVNPEDARMFGNVLKSRLEVSQVEHPTAERAAFCWRNDLENIPLFLILALGFVLVGGSTEWGLVSFAVYAIARISHTVFYMCMLQPWRTIAYEIGAVATVLMAAHTVYIVLR